MKKIYLLTVFVCCCTLLHQQAQAQDHEVVYISAVPEWVPQKGFWVIESNKKTPKHYRILFYNDQHELVYREEVNGVRLKLKKEKVKLRLKKALETALLAWENNQTLRENQQLVINQLKAK